MWNRVARWWAPLLLGALLVGPGVVRAQDGEEGEAPGGPAAEASAEPEEAPNEALGAAGDAEEPAPAERDLPPWVELRLAARAGGFHEPQSGERFGFAGFGFGLALWPAGGLRVELAGSLDLYRRALWTRRLAGPQGGALVVTPREQARRHALRIGYDLLSLAEAGFSRGMLVVELEAEHLLFANDTLPHAALWLGGGLRARYEVVEGLSLAATVGFGVAVVRGWEELQSAELYFGETQGRLRLGGGARLAISEAASLGLGYEGERIDYRRASLWQHAAVVDVQLALGRR